MSTTAVRSNEAASNGHAGQVDLKLEVITVPVSDFDRAKEFYQNLGWRLDIDFINGDGRAIQFTPPGSQCSIHLGKKVTQPAQDISSIFDLRDPELVVSDIEAARDDLKRRGVEVSEVFHFGGSAGPFGGLAGGIAPGHQSYGSYATFKDPDGTAGCCRRSRRGSRDGSLATRCIRRWATWRRLSGGRRPPTASTRSAPVSEMPTGRRGTRRT